MAQSKEEVLSLRRRLPSQRRTAGSESSPGTGVLPLEVFNLPRLFLPQWLQLLAQAARLLHRRQMLGPSVVQQQPACAWGGGSSGDWFGAGRPCREVQMSGRATGSLMQLHAILQIKQMGAAIHVHVPHLPVASAMMMPAKIAIPAAAASAAGIMQPAASPLHVLVI